jgi:hypothetical protein
VGEMFLLPPPITEMFSFTSMLKYLRAEAINQNFVNEEMDFQECFLFPSAIRKQSLK